MSELNTAFVFFMGIVIGISIAALLLGYRRDE